jgi:hypothetical protein
VKTLTGRTLALCAAVLLAYAAVEYDRATTGGEYVWIFIALGLAAGVALCREMYRMNSRP